MFAKLKAEVASHLLIYLLLTVSLVGAFFIRVYRVDQILGFYFDQGRDALVIREFLTTGKLFLVGPTTGIAGIFRGPWYYWLIAPVYFLGAGDPVWVSAFLSLLSVAAIFVLFFLAKEIAGYKAGLIAAVIASFSYYIMIASRWLSNPTPMLLISMLIVYTLFRLADAKKVSKYWLVLAFLLGMAMQFGSAAEVFYFPVVILLAIWKRKTLTKRILFFAFCLLLVAFLPQVLFDIRHGGILVGNIKKFLFDEGSFKIAFWDIVKLRMPFYWDLFTNKIWPGEPHLIRGAMFLGFVTFVYYWRTLVKNTKFVMVLLLWLSPIIGMLFFQGNYGNVYDYYFTGYYLIFILIYSVVLSMLVRKPLGIGVVMLFFIVYFKVNIELNRNYIIAGVDGPTTIAFGNQKQAIDWVYQDAKGNPFSVDVYVPPVIPYAYDYLFSWYGHKISGYEPSREQINPLYTLFETDPPHPERLEAWLERQAGIGVVEAEARFGGIVVQRRKRI